MKQYYFKDKNEEMVVAFSKGAFIVDTLAKVISGVGMAMIVFCITGLVERTTDICKTTEEEQ